MLPGEANLWHRSRGQHQPKLKHTIFVSLCHLQMHEAGGESAQAEIPRTLLGMVPNQEGETCKEKTKY